MSVPASSVTQRVSGASERESEAPPEHGVAGDCAASDCRVERGRGTGGERAGGPTSDCQSVSQCRSSSADLVCALALHLQPPLNDRRVYIRTSVYDRFTCSDTYRIVISTLLLSDTLLLLWEYCCFA